jgi:type IX secretion system PorP/SprF family membrane protein
MKIMKRKKVLMTLLGGNFLMLTAWGQDPGFSQFFSSPLNVNPALTAHTNGSWRFISNLRDQWVGPASPYTTGTVSFDARLLQKKLPEGNTFGVGAMMMYDKAMQGALKSTYASLNVSYNITLSEENATQRLGIGIGGIFGSKRVDFSKLDFGEQFTGYGFDTNLPTGEIALSNMKPYLSTSAGILYSITTDNSNLDLGIAGFHMNKPKQSVLDDPNQYLAARYVGHANFDTYLSDQLVLNANSIYQRQETTDYISFGGGLGYFVTGDPEDLALNIGLWYWVRNAFIPYIGIMYQNIQFGLSYDIAFSKLSRAAEKPKSFELSLIIRPKKPKGFIPSPWN